ncbi:MAG: histidine phosphatase family protein [Gemmatimonadota bacterium]|jgi:broad specificity phosphatase PhoE
MRRFAPAFTGFLLAASAAAPLAAQSGPATSVYLVRHAEKAATPADDPLLTADGEARAQALADVLRDARVQAIFVTQYARTQLTATPTARRAGIDLTVVAIRAGAMSAAAAVDANVRATAERIRANPGTNALVVGHSNTIPAIIRALGAPDPGPIADDDYDNFFVVTLQEGRAPTLVRARYGR